MSYVNKLIKISLGWGHLGKGTRKRTKEEGMEAVMRRLVWHRTQQTRGDSGGRRVSTKEVAFGSHLGWPLPTHWPVLE